MTLRHGMRTLLTPDALRGRVAAVNRTLAAGGPQLGEFEKGVLASFIGAGPAVAAGGIATLLTAGIVTRLVPQISAYRLSSSIVSDSRSDKAQPAPATAD
jgi:hypothetical protein